MRRIALALGLVVVFSVVGFSMGYSQSGRDNKLKAPQFTLKPINGDKECQIGGDTGKYTVLLFWTTWCPHCSVAMQDMNDYFNQYGDRVKFCAVAIGESPEKVRAYLSARGIRFPVFVDERGTIGYVYGVMGVPTIFVIDPQGYVVDYGYGLRRIMRRLLNSLNQKAVKGGSHG